jgi:hypothetical protein
MSSLLPFQNGTQLRPPTNSQKMAVSSVSFDLLVVSIVPAEIPSNFPVGANLTLFLLSGNGHTTQELGLMVATLIACG